MSNQFVLLPTPVGNGIGTAVDISTYGALKTIVVTGSATSTKNIEINNDSAQGGSWSPVATVQNNGTASIAVAAHWIRVRVSGYNTTIGGSSQVNLGGDDTGCEFVALPATIGNGTGAAVDVTAHAGPYMTVQVGGPFGGTTVIEVSEDGSTEWGTLCSLQNPGQTSVTAIAGFLRAKRVGVPALNPGLPVVNVGFSSLPGGGGGGGTSGVDLEDEGTPVTGNPHTTLNFVGAGVAVTDVAGVGTITIPGATGIALQDEGTPVTGNPHATVNFVGAGVTVTDAAGVGTVTIPGATGIALQDEGTPVTGNPHSTVNFVGSGVVVTDVGGVGTVTIAGGGGGIALQDEGIAVTGNPHSTVNFVGAGVTATDVGGVGTITVPGGGSIPGQITLGSIISPPATGGVQIDNYNPTGFGNCSWLRINVDFLTTITGMAAQPAGTIVFITNVGVNVLLFAAESSSSTAANRFTNITGTTWYLNPDGSYAFIYDGVAGRWRQFLIGSNSFPESDAAGTGPGLLIGSKNTNIGLASATGGVALVRAGVQLTADNGRIHVINNLVLDGPNSETQILNNLRIDSEVNVNLGANVNDWGIFGSTFNVVRVDQSTPGFTVSGLSAPPNAGYVRTLLNISAFPLTLLNQDGASSPGNRFALPGATAIIAANDSYTVWYDGTSLRWRRFN